MINSSSLRISIYATLLGARKYEERTYFWVDVFDSCKELQNLVVLFMNWDEQDSQDVKISSVNDLPDDEEVNAKVNRLRRIWMTLCTPWEIINKAKTDILAPQTLVVKKKMCWRRK